jgi:hypothetical protein
LFYFIKEEGEQYEEGEQRGLFQAHFEKER